MKNIAASVRAKLSNLAKNNKLGFQLICSRYFHERLLYRLSISGYSRNFILKGGGLLYYFNKLKTRPTLDIDFLGQYINNEKNEIAEAFKEVCAISIPEDGLIFNLESIESEAINEQADYTGIRLRIEVFLGQIKQRIQIDIGFGDVVTPKPILIEFPVLLNQFASPLLIAYTKESVIAEKFQTMIELSGLNSRMKDFFDLYNLFENEIIDNNELEIAIHSTFNQRNTIYIENHHLFSENFIDATKLRQWKTFLKKAVLPENLKLEVVHNVIITKLKPIWERMKN